MKRDYQRPVVQTVLLQHHCPLLSGSDATSGINAEISGYSSSDGGGFDQED